MSDTDESKVVSINGSTIPGPGRPSKATISELERVLEAAKSGEIVGVVMACLHADNLTSSVLAGHVSAKAVLGAIDVAKHDLLMSSYTDRE